MTTAIVWFTKPDDVEDGLAYGTEDGYLCIWKKNRNEDEVSQASEINDCHNNIHWIVHRNLL